MFLSFLQSFKWREEFFLKASFMILNEANIWVKAKQVQEKGLFK